MCGIVGFLDKRPSAERPLGRTLLTMLQALGCRGPDSTGVALYDPAVGWHLRLSAPGLSPKTVLAALRDAGLPSYRHAGGVFDALLEAQADPATVEDQVLALLPGSEVICLGRQLDLFKQVGPPAGLEEAHDLSRRGGTHGLGHTRLSTESRVDLSHSQPFWAHGVPDLATAHNGHITNYHKLRRRFEQQGHRFYTENDSEVIGVYLRDRLTAGLSLADALRSSLDDFDGSYCYLAATGECLAYVKDRFGLKPLVLAETDNFVALATEELALRQALGDGFVAREPAPGTMRVWAVSQVLSERPG